MTRHEFTYPMPNTYADLIAGGIFSYYSHAVLMRTVACIILAYTFYHRLVIFLLVVDKLSVFKAFRPVGISGEKGYLFHPRRMIQRTHDVFKMTRNTLIQLKLGLLYFVVVCKDSRFIARVFEDQKFFAKKCSDRYEMLIPLVGQGFLQGPLYRNGRWKRCMNVLNNFLRSKLIESHIPTLDYPATKLVDILELKNTANGIQVDIFPLLSKCVLDMIFNIAIGKQCSTDYYYCSERLHRLLAKKMYSWCRRTWFYRFYVDQKTEEDCIELMHDEVMEHIIRKVGGVYPQHFEEEEEDDVLSRNYLEALMNFRNLYRNDDTPFDNEDYLHAVQYFVYNAHHPIATALSFAILTLGWYTTIQEALYLEQKYVFEDEEEMVAQVAGEEKEEENEEEKMLRAATPAKLDMMIHLDRFINEVLRIYPPVPLIYLETRQPKHLFNETLPAGSKLWIHMFAYLRTFHGDEHDHFEAEYVDECPQPGAPVFGSQKYGCVGRNLAVTIMKVILSRILRAYIVRQRIEESKLTLLCETVLRSQEGYPIEFVPRVVR